MAETAIRPDKDARRREILDAALLEFAAKGFSGTSMEAIARRAKASKETLYSWFVNKETLFRAVFEARLNSLGTHASAAVQKDPHPANVLPVIARDIVKMLVAMEPLNRAAASAGAGAPALARGMGEAIADERKNFVRYIEWCQQLGVIEFDDDPYEIASTFVAMAQGEWSMRLGYRLVDKVTDEMIDTHAQRVTRLFLKAVAPQKKR
ncbi:MAG TPA: TetR/AcrR family transcriptional regulator [Rhizomicrobium sp.]|nr:TetR/AcrR family transcriptional regulator [Rhizomicrobium sp.]